MAFATVVAIALHNSFVVAEIVIRTFICTIIIQLQL